jgi:signal transduction histidine kinase
MVSSLIELAKPLQENYHLTRDIDISDDMQRPVKYAIIGIVKECISNIIKHSNNTSVDIRLLEHPSMYQLVVHDYGEPAKSEVEDRKTKVSVGSVDMQEKDSAGVGMGLENIRTRAQSVGGTCNITDDNGFRVFVTIPR